MRAAIQHCLLLLALCTVFVSPSAKADFIRVEENAASVAYSGSWQTHTGAYLSGGSLAASAQPGARATITFSGTGIRWVSYGCSCVAGPAHVYLDGVLQVTTTPVPAWADLEPKREKFRISGLASGTHTLTIEVADNLPGWAGPTVGSVAVDAFYVERASQTGALQESDAAITYTGDWVEMDDAAVSGGSVMATSAPGATATVRFNGTGLSWVGYRCPCTGLGHTSLDAFGPASVNTYATTREAQATVYAVNGLADGEHQLRIENAGSTSGGPWLVVDAFRVYGPDGPDMTPPDITIRAPVQGQTVHGVVEIVTDLFEGQGESGNVYAAQQDFFIDGVQVQIPRPGGNPRMNWWYTTEFSDGPHVLTVVARDAAGNETRSAPVTVIVDNANAPDFQPPQVSLTAPAPNSQVTGIVTLSATASDNSGIARVTFHAGLTPNADTLLGEDTTAPYSITRDTSNLPSGQSYYVLARAYDSAGNMSYTSAALVTVQH